MNEKETTQTAVARTADLPRRDLQYAEQEDHQDIGPICESWTAQYEVEVD